MVKSGLLIGGGVVILAVAAALGAFFFFSSASADTETMAQNIVDLCSKENDHQACYEREVPPLYGKYTIPQLFDVIRGIRQKDTTYQFCHVLAHKLGQEAVLADPDDWISLMPLNPPDGMCSNGFMHGVTLGLFRNSVLDDETIERNIPNFSRACEPNAKWQPSSLDQAICYHGLGHLFMFITDANIPKALDVCKRVSQSPTGDYSRVCREGVFMQIYQPLEPDDFELLESLPEKPTKENYRRLCSVYGDEDEGACLREAWALSRESVMSGGKGIAAFCSGQPNSTEEDRCYESGLTLVGRQTQNDPDHAAELCTTLPQKRQLQCYIIVAQAFIEEDRSQSDVAMSVCAKAPGSMAESCARELLARSTFLFGQNSPYRDRFCASLFEKFALSCK